MENININKNQIKGIGGWLILPAISIVISIPYMLFTIVSGLNDIVFSGLWLELSSADSPYYLSGFLPVYIFEVLGNIIFFLANCYLAYLFFTKHYKAPKFFIYMNIAYVIFILLDAIVCMLVLESPFDSDSKREVIRSIIYCAIWIPYFLQSIRVKNTFINGKPNYDTISDKPSLVG